MSKSSAVRLFGKTLAGSAAALLLCSFGTPSTASAFAICPAGATVGGISETSTTTSGPLDGTCGANSAVTVNIPASTDYGKLTFNSATPGFPATSLNNLLGLSANMSFTSGGTDLPYYELAFFDGSGSLGQASSADQILLIEFQPGALSGGTLALDPSATLFNLYDNTTGNYLEGGQSDTNTLAGWLAADPSLGGAALQEVRIAMGLTGGDTGPESMTVNSLDMTIPEPASLTLLGVALTGLGFSRRKRAG